jgi:GNAT superfamily N-acetyltransferase
VHDITLVPLAFSDTEIAQVVDLYTSNPEYGRTAGFPWIGLLMVHGSRQRSGLGRAMTATVSRLLLDRGERGVRLAVLEKHSSAEAFWRSLGWVEIDRRPDRAYGRPCIVMHKTLQGHR